MKATPLAAVALLAFAAVALGDDGADPAPVEVEGSIKLGWRLLRDEHEHGFLQDVGLQDGPRIFDFEFLAFDPTEDATLTELELRAHGIGDRNSDYTLTIRGGDLFRLESGYRRDLHHYRADGNPFPYDTTRERTFVRGRLTPSRDLTIRLGWERSERRGKAFTSFDSDARELPVPAGVDPDIVGARRPLDQRYDTFTAGVDYAAGIFRFGLTESVRVGRVDDERFYDVPRSRRGGATPTREALRRQLDSVSYTTVGRVGATIVEDQLDATLFVTHTRLPLDADVSGATRGFDNVLAAGTPRGAFSAVLGGATDVDREIEGWRVESLWRPTPDVEVVGELGQHDTVDDADLHLVERRTYDRTDVPDERVLTRRRARVTDRTDRAALETAWDATDDVRLRAGYERYQQDLAVPTDSRRGKLVGSLVRSTTHRYTVGADVEPVEDLELSALYRRADNDEPHAAPSAAEADEMVFRGRWRASDDVFVTGVFRRRTIDDDETRDSTSRTQSASLAASWSSGPLALDGSVTWQEFDTRTDTAFFVTQGLFTRRVAGTVAFRTSDLVYSLDARYEFTPTTRLGVTATVVDSSGDFGLETHDLALRGEHDLSEDVTIGAALRSWRYNEDDRSRDDYDTEGVEVFLEYRF